MSKEHHTFTWQGIKIELTYEPRAYDGATANLLIDWCLCCLLKKSEAK